MSNILKLNPFYSKKIWGYEEWNLSTHKNGHSKIVGSETTLLETINKEKSKVDALSNHRKEFFDNLTHEIKTPLTAITGYAEMLKEGMVIDEKFEKRAINRIYLESERVNRLVLDLIAVSKGLSENIEESKVINAKTIIDPLVEDLQIKADKYSLDIISKVLDGDILVQEDKYIFTVKNKIKSSSIALISFSVCSILTVFVGLNFIHNEDAKIIYIVAVGAFYNVLRLLTFLPIYGAKCLDYKITTFYPAILKNVLSVVILVVLAFGIGFVLHINSWIKLILACAILGVLGLTINIFILFNKDERNENLKALKEKIKRSKEKVSE